MALTKAEIAENLSGSLGLNKREAKEFVDIFFAQVVDGIIKTGCVKLSGFGNFVTRHKNQRPGRNPKTGEDVIISERTVVTFHAGQKLKAEVEAYQEKANGDNEQ